MQIELFSGTSTNMSKKKTGYNQVKQLRQKLLTTFIILEYFFKKDIFRTK